MTLPKFPEFVLWMVALLLLVAAMGLLLSRNWRWSVAFLALQYVGMFLLVSQQWMLGMAASRLITGIMAAFVLTQTLTDKDTSLPAVEAANLPGGRLFRLFAALLVLISVIQAAALMSEWFINTSLPFLIGALILIGMGLLHLGITANPFRVTLGLLTTLSGFETIFSVLQNSLVVTALMSVVIMALAVVGAYLINQDVQPEVIE